MTRRSMMRMGAPVVGDGLAMHLAGRLFTSPPEVLAIEGEERANELYRFEVRFTLDPRDDISQDRSLLHMPIELALATGREGRHVHGIVTSLQTEVGTVGHRPIYRVTLQPRASLLTRRRHCRVYQDQTIIQIVTTLLAEHRVVFRLRLVSTYPKRAFTVQYHESDWEFATRLLAEAGVLLYFDHPTAQGDAIETGMGNSEVLVLSDTAQYYPPLIGGHELVIRSASTGLELPENALTDLTLRAQAGSTVRLVRAYDFGRPLVDVKDTHIVESGEEPALVYEFGGEGDESPPEVEHARTRLEQDRVDTVRAEGRSVCRRLSPGRTFQLAGHHVPGVDGRYVVASVRHQAYAAAACPPGCLPYENRLEAVPEAVLLRPPSPSRRPRLTTETAVVVGPSGTEQHVDALGRIKVQFHWDLAGRRDERSSCWVRVAQSLAGTGWGAQFIPRVGMEVVITFLGGDPDRPLVTHAVYNATHPLPFPVPQEVTKSGVRTSSTPGGQGFHEISFDDASGSELMFVHAQRNAERIVREDDAERVGRDQRLEVGRDRTTQVGRKDIATIGEEHSRAIGGGSRTGTTMADGTLSLTTGGATLTLAGANATLSADADITFSAGSNIHCVAGSAMTIDAPLVTIQADTIEIMATGNATLEAGATISIKGGTVKVTGGTISEN